MIIRDGTGLGFEAAVDSKNRLKTFSNVQDETIENLELGNAYNINTGLITSVNSDSSVIYFKNNEDGNYIIEAIAFAEFDGITHSDKPYIIVYKNVTGGDIISDATSVSMFENRNFGSTKTLGNSFAYKGKNGGTITGGTEVGYFQHNGSGRSFYSVNFDVPKGNSIGVKYISNVTSGSASIYAALIGYLKPEA